MDKLLIIQDKDELLLSIRSIVREEIEAKNKTEQLEKFLSPMEVCTMFQPKISKPTLVAWTKNGRLTEHRIGSRIFYRYSEVLDAITRLKKYKRTTT